MKLTDGYYINPFIIWKELDYRGYISVGFQVEAFDGIRVLKKLPGRKQIICQNGEMLIFLSVPIAELCPNKSIFNLSDKKLQAFYNSTLEKAKEYFDDCRFKLSNMINQEVNYLEDVEHFALLSDFFHVEDDELFLDTSQTIMDNCLDSQKIEKAVSGFKMADHYHNVFVIDKYSHNYRAIFNNLKDFHLTIIFTDEGSQIVAATSATSEEKMIKASHEIKSKILELPGTNSYEPNDTKESFSFFEACIPGWMYGSKQQLAESTAGDY